MTDTSSASLERSDILVVSHASIHAVNREVYRSLRRGGYRVAMLIAEGVRGVTGEFFPADPLLPDDPPAHFRPTVGRNLRTMRFSCFAESLNEFNPEIVLVEYDPASRVALEAALWCKRHGRKLVCRTNENLSWLPSSAYRRGGARELPGSFAKTAMHLLNRSQVRAVCTTSDAAAEMFRENGYRRVANLPMGTDRKRFRYDSSTRRRSREQLGLSASAPVVAYFGRLVPEKGLDTLIEALRQMKDLSWSFLMNEFEVSSNYAKRIERMIEESGIGNRLVRATARHGDVSELMIAADVVVLPSRTTLKWVEQFGRVVPEAMACGALVLVSDSGAPKELVADPLLIFQEGNAESLVSLLRRLANNPEACLRYRRSGMRRVQRYLSTEVEAKLLSKVLADVAKD